MTIGVFFKHFEVAVKGHNFSTELLGKFQMDCIIDTRLSSFLIEQNQARVVRIDGMFSPNPLTF